MKKLKMKTPDLIEKNIEQIEKLFPNVITEIKDEKGNIRKGIDFDLLKQNLSDILVEDENERYRLDWPGKKASLLKANTPINKTLRPVIEDSVDFENTENLYIEGDNFEVLKILQESYLNKVKMIYIDPPYNTGKDFIYKDNRKISKEQYEENIGMIDEDGGKLFKNTDSNGRFHSDWLSMMYERLIVARDLLKDDGVIFISIDDNEVHNLRKICDEIFGEENFIGELIRKTKSMTGDKSTGLNLQHENLIIYSKNQEYFVFSGEEKKFDTYKNPDNDINGKWTSGDPSAKSGNETTYFAINNPYSNKKDFPPKGRYWAFSKKTLDEYIKKGKIKFKIKYKYNERGFVFKRYKNKLESSCNPVNSLFSIENCFMNQAGTKELKNILGNEYFVNPKPELFIHKLIQYSTKNKDLILDFFSGSATTAHAVMQLNAEDGGSRKFIMVQLPEKTDEKSEAYKAGYKTIAEIGKERIRRAGKQIMNDLIVNKKKKKEQLTLFDDKNNSQLIIHNSQLKKLDIGFRVYKTDTTNLKDVFYHPEDLSQRDLKDLITNIKEDRTPKDLLTQVILDLGLELNLPIDKKNIHGNSIFIVHKNALVACFDEDINFKIVDEIAEIKPFKVVFRDSSFKDDKDRINVEERFKRLSPETRISII